MTTPGCRTIPKWEHMLIQNYQWLLMIQAQPIIYRLTKFLRKRKLTPDHIGTPGNGSITLYFNNNVKHGDIKIYDDCRIIGSFNDDSYPDYNLENDERLGKFVKDLRKHLDSGS